MQKLKKKLKSNSGVTIIFALLFLLVMTVISALLMTASSTNLDRTDRRLSEQKSYFAISSAAKLIQQSFGGTVCDGYERRTIYGCTMKSELVSQSTLTPKTESDINAISPSFTVSGDNTKLKKLITDAAFKLYLSRPKEYVSPTAEPQFVQSPGVTAKPITFKISGDNLPDVTVSMIFDRDYNATFELTAPDSNYSMTLVFKATVTQDSKSAPLVTDGPNCTHSYSKLVRQPDGTMKYQTFTVTSTGEIRTLRINLFWDNGTILKGVVKS